MEAVVANVIESLVLCLHQEITDLPVRRQEIELLLAEVKQMKSFLTVSIKQEDESAEIRKWFLAVREVAYEVEDFADDLSYEIMRKGAGDGEENRLSYFGLKFKELKARFKFSRAIASLTARIRDINVTLEGLAVRDAPSKWVEQSDFPVKTDLWMRHRESSSLLIDDIFVGMEDEKEKLVSLLISEERESTKLRVISIVGMGGIGKTTLAKKVYKDCRIRYHFESFAWATVGRDLRIRNVMESLLLQLSVVESREEMMPSSDLDLAQRLFESQLSKKYLIVLDDVWDAWECLRIAFPSDQTGCRVLLTTRCKEAVERISVKKGIIHQMRFLNQEEEWELLQKTAMRTDYLDYKVHQDMLKIGKDIARSCRGLPLTVKLVGGLLVAKRTSHDWEMVYQNIVSYENLDRKMVHQDVVLYPNSSKGFEEIKNIPPILELTYHHLPHYLKQCFLYLVMFPEGADIEAESLYLHWFAEGMIPYRDGESKETMMDIAEGYLYELAVRSMVLVQEEDIPNTRRFKSCRLNNVMRDLCLFKLKEDFFDVTYLSHSNRTAKYSHSPFSTLEIPRLPFYFQDLWVVPIAWKVEMYPWSMSLGNKHQYQQKFMSKSGFSTCRDLTRLRVLCLSGNFEIFRLPSVRAKLLCPEFLHLRDLPQLLSDLTDLRRLRVLHISDFNCKVMRLPGGIEKLSRLRFLSLRNCNITRLPSPICSLFNLETLYLRDCPGMIIPNELQKLTRLRYLYLPRSFKVHGVDKLHVDGFRKLEILVNFDSRVCDSKDLFKLTKLWKLVATIDNLEDLEAIMDCINMNLHNLRLSSLVVRNLGRCLREKTFLASKLFQSPNLHCLHVEGDIGKLPQNISQSLNQISFSGSKLEEDPIKKLEKLPNLCVLALRNNAFLGKHMMCSSLGMPRLKSLMLSNLQNLEMLAVEKGGMPKLCKLSIRNCPGLVELPEGLSFLKTETFLDKLQERGENSYKVRPSQTLKKLPLALDDELQELGEDFQNSNGCRLNGIHH